MNHTLNYNLRIQMADIRPGQPPKSIKVSVASTLRFSPFDMQIFRLLHRRTKSEGDVSTLQFQQGVTGVIAPVFVPLQVSLPSFDPTRELYAAPTNPVQGPMVPSSMDKLNARIIELESQVVHLQKERSTLEQDLVDYRADLLHARTELYSEMLRSARHQQQAMDDFRTIQKLEARHQRFCTLLVDIGVSRSTVDEICEILQSGNGSPDNILVDAIKHATNDDNTLLARLKPIVTAERTPEHYQSALNLTLSIRKELKSQKKRSKFWKKLAQEDDLHASIITPSPSDISSIRQDLSPERQCALESLVARRRAARHSENVENDVFGGRRESVLDTLASSLAYRPRRSTQDDLGFSSSFSSSSASSASTTYFSYISGLSRFPRGATTETPTMPSYIPSTLSVSLRRSSRGSSQSIVLGNISLNVSRSSSINHALPEEAEQHTNPDTGGPVTTVTHSQDLLQNVRRAPQENGHRRMPSTSSRRSGPTHSARSSFRLSAVSPVRACRPTGTLAASDLDISGHTAVDTPSFHTPDVMMRLSDLATNTNPILDTPASTEVTRSEDTPFNDTRVLPKYYGVDTPFSPSDLEPQVASTPLDGSGPCKPLDGNAYSLDTRFLEHLECSMSMSMSTSTSASTSESSANAQDRHECELEDDHAHAETGTIPLGESNDSLFTTSASASASSSLTANETPAPTTPPTPSPSPALSPSLGSTPPSGMASIKRSMLPVLAKHLRRLSLSGTSPDRGRLMDKLRGLRSLSRSRSGSGSGSGSGSPFESVWRGSPARSESSRSSHLSPSPSPVKGSGIPMLQRRMTIRARRTSVRKV